MTTEQRSDRELAPLPTPEDIRLLLAEVRKLELALSRVDLALDAALWAASAEAFAQVRRES